MQLYRGQLEDMSIKIYSNLYNDLENIQLSSSGLTYNPETDCFGCINPYTDKWVNVLNAYFNEGPLVPTLTSNSGGCGNCICKFNKYYSSTSFCCI